MEKETLRESLQHGTTAFPLAVYHIRPLLNGTLNPDPVLCPEACECIYALYQTYEASSFGYELYLRHCLLKIFYLLLKDTCISNLSVQNSKSIIVKNVLDFIKQNYQEPVTLQQLAEHAHVSREYLCRLFHQLSGSSPVEYLNRYRIRQSTFLLLQTEERISDIALSCGFSHSSYFGKLFFEQMGCTPTEYRKKHQQ